MAGGVDYSDMKGLLENLQDNLEAMNRFYEQCCKELAARLLAKVIPRTPVGHKPDFLLDSPDVKVKLRSTRNAKLKNGMTLKREAMQNRSFLSADGATYQRYWSDYQGGDLRRGWTGGKKIPAKQYAQMLPIRKVGSAYVIEVINPLEYASYVENGHRQTPGRYVPALNRQLVKGWIDGVHMLEISENEVRNSTKGVLARNLKRYMEGMFNAK